MGAQAKIIKMLLYDDGSLDGVLRIEDSNWNEGELFSAPRDSVNDLLEKGACNKYGVYLLLSPNMVYVGQSSDLAKRLTQHISGKDWWESVVILTTKDDSLNHSDVDYLENVLIKKAFAIKKLDCDNKKSGNPPKVDTFRKVYLDQYLEKYLFLMQLIGIKVFSETKKAKRKSSGSSNDTHNVPPLPSGDMKIGMFVYTAMQNLSDAGYVFTPEAIDEMCSSEWSWQHFHTEKCFMKRYIPGITDNKGLGGYIRFKSTPYSFGDQQVLISKEWYEYQRQYFINWYESLR